MKVSKQTGVDISRIPEKLDERGGEEPKRLESAHRVFLSAFVFWCVVVLGGALMAGSPSAAYGVLNIGAIFGVVAIFDSLVSAILVLAHLKDWRAWASLVLSGVTVAASMLRSTHQMGP